ncbi:MAG: hypothetical protein FIB02_11970, partial [Desulfuromonas sp.]|nr:hypothetical protein [Desulfuromonas sp.]
MNATVTEQPLSLNLPGFSYADLYNPQKLQQLLQVFDAEVATRNAALATEFDAYRACGGEGL